MGTRERRGRERLETRDKILGAAREMFAEDGYDAVTMRAIAERIEYTPTAIYHHFENKQALLTELCQSDFRELAHHFRGLALSPDAIERIKGVGRAYLEFAEKHPSQYRFMFMTVMPQPDLTPEYVQQTQGNPEHDAYAFLRLACQEAIDSGRLRPEIRDADQLAQILWSNVHGLISLRIVKNHDSWVPWRDLRETAELSMDTQLRGLLRESGGKS